MARLFVATGDGIVRLDEDSEALTADRAAVPPGRWVHDRRQQTCAAGQA
jgi:hypothetical protein